MANGKSGGGHALPKKLTPEDIKKLQDWARMVDGYRRLAEGETVPGLKPPEELIAELGLQFPPSCLPCILALVPLLCGGCIIICGGPEDIPCIMECCGETWEEILEMCGCA